MIDALPLGEIGWQHAPLDPTFGHIKDGIEYGPHTQGARSSTAFGGGDQIFDPLQFLVCQVAWIYFFVHIPILHNPRRLFRQALRAIDGFSGILLDVIRSNTQRMGQLIDDLLAFSRLSRQEFAKSPIDMAQLVQSVVAEMRRVEPNRSVAITIHPLAPSYGDSAMLRQVFANLISNALKFSQHQPQASVEI